MYEGRRSEARVLERSAITSAAAAAAVGVNGARVPFGRVAIVEGGWEVGRAHGWSDVGTIGTRLELRR